MEIDNILNGLLPNKIVAFNGDFVLNNNIVCIADKTEANVNNYNDFFLSFCSKEKLQKALDMFHIKNEMLEVPIKSLSQATLNVFSIINALLSDKNIILFNEIDKAFNDREQKNIKKILIKLKEYGKTIIISNSNTEFLIDITSDVYVFKDNVLLTEFKNVNWFNEEVYKYLDKPPIIEFINFCNEKNIKIEGSFDRKELLKSIYRSVDK